MPKARKKLPKGVHVHESGSVYICYKNEQGKIIRENTHQTDVRAAELMLAQARTDVALKRRFTSLSFENARFIELFNDWWENHGSRTRSKFQYRTPRVLARFKTMKAREITPCSPGLPGGPASERSGCFEHQSVPDDPLQRIQLRDSVREI